MQTQILTIIIIVLAYVVFLQHYKLHISRCDYLQQKRISENLKIENFRLKSEASKYRSKYFSKLF